MFFKSNENLYFHDLIKDVKIFFMFAYFNNKLPISFPDIWVKIVARRNNIKKQNQEKKERGSTKKKNVKKLKPKRKRIHAFSSLFRTTLETTSSRAQTTRQGEKQGVD